MSQYTTIDNQMRIDFHKGYSPPPDRENLEKYCEYLGLKYIKNPKESAFDRHLAVEREHPELWPSRMLELMREARIRYYDAEKKLAA